MSSNKHLRRLAAAVNHRQALFQPGKLPSHRFDRGQEYRGKWLARVQRWDTAIIEHANLAAMQGELPRSNRVATSPEGV